MDINEAKKLKKKIAIILETRGVLRALQWLMDQKQLAQFISVEVEAVDGNKCGQKIDGGICFISEDDLYELYFIANDSKNLGVPSLYGGEFLFFHNDELVLHTTYTKGPRSRIGGSETSLKTAKLSKWVLNIPKIVFLEQNERKKRIEAELKEAEAKEATVIEENFDLGDYEIWSISPISNAQSSEQEPDDGAPKEMPILIIGLGGVGCNVINNISKYNMEHCKFLYINYDLDIYKKSDIKSKIGLNLDRYRSFESAFKDRNNELEEILSGVREVFIVAGLGGKCGSIILPLLGKFIANKNLPLYAAVTTPFQFEGLVRSTRAFDVIEKSENIFNDMRVFDNQELFRMANEKTKFVDAFEIGDKKIHEFIEDTIQSTMLNSV